MTNDEKHAVLIGKMVEYFKAQPQERREVILYALLHVDDPPPQVTLEEIQAHIQKIR